MLSFVAERATTKQARARGIAQVRHESNERNLCSSRGRDAKDRFGAIPADVPRGVEQGMRSKQSSQKKRTRTGRLQNWNTSKCAHCTQSARSVARCRRPKTFNAKHVQARGGRAHGSEGRIGKIREDIRTGLPKLRSKFVSVLLQVFHVSCVFSPSRSCDGVRLFPVVAESWRNVSSAVNSSRFSPSVSEWFY